MNQETHNEYYYRILTVPNVISLIRILGSVLISILATASLISGLPLLLLSLSFAMTDYIDGFIARKYHMQSKYGKVLDPIADKLFAVGLLTSLLVNNYYVPLMLIPLGIIATRDVIVTAGMALYAKKKKMETAPKPSLAAKLKTTLLFTSLALKMVSLNNLPLSIISDIFLSLAALCPIKEVIDIARHKGFNQKDVNVDVIGHTLINKIKGLISKLKKDKQTTTSINDNCFIMKLDQKLHRLENKIDDSLHHVSSEYINQTAIIEPTTIESEPSDEIIYTNVSCDVEYLPTNDKHKMLVYKKD